MPNNNNFFRLLSKCFHSNVYLLGTLALIAGIALLAACKGPNNSVEHPTEVLPTLKITTEAETAVSESIIRFTAELANADSSEGKISHEIVTWSFEVGKEDISEDIIAELRSHITEDRREDGSFALGIGEDIPVGAVITVHARYEGDHRANDSAVVTIRERDFTVTGITITPEEGYSATIFRDATAIFNAVVDFDNPSGTVVQGTVRWELVSYIDGDDYSTGGVDLSGNQVRLHMSDSLEWEQPGEDRTLTLRAISNDQSSKFGETTITVPYPIIKKVTIATAQKPEVEPTAEVRFTSEVEDEYNAPKGIRWEISGNKAPETKIELLGEKTGILTVGNEPQGTIIEVWAKSDFDPTVESDKISITVLEATKVYVNKLDITLTDPHAGTDFVGQNKTHRFTAKADFSKEAGFIVPANPTFVWSIANHSSSDTKITENGDLYVAANEIAKEITVKAVVIHNEVERAAPGFLTVKVPYAESIELEPDAEEKNRGENVVFNHTVIGQGSPEQTVIWELRADTAGEITAGTSFTSSNRTLAISPNQAPGKLIVKATSVITPSVFKEAVITVREPVATSVELVPTSKAVNRGDNLSFTVKVLGTGNPEQTVNWSFDNGSIAQQPGTGFTDNNTLAIAQDQTPGTLKVRATSTRTPGVFATAEITVLAPVVTGVTVVTTPENATVPRGATVNFAVTIEGTGYPDQKYGLVSLGTNLLDGTVIEGNSLLRIDANQTPVTFKVRATSQYDTSKFTDKDVTVLAATVESVAIAATTANVVRGGIHGGFTATVTQLNGAPTSVTWTVESSSATKHPGTSFNGATLIVDKDQLPGTLTVRATSTFDPSKSSAPSTITVGQPRVSKVDISGNGVTHNGNDYAVRVSRVSFIQLSANVVEVANTGHPDQSITWTISNSTGGNSITPNGLLTVGRDFNDNAITVVARSAAGINESSQSSNLIVTVPPTPETIELFGAPDRVTRGESSSRIGAQVSGKGSPMPAVAWTLHYARPDRELYQTGAGNNETADGTNVQGGVLNVNGLEGYGTGFVIVRATSVGSPNVFAEKQIAITGNRVVGAWRMVRTGIDHTMALTWKGELYTWGRNAYGQLGLGNRETSVNNTNTIRKQPTKVETPGVTNKWRYVSGGWSHTVALHDDNTIWITGRIAQGGTGTQIVDYGNTLQKLSDVKWKAAFASHSAIFAIREDDGSLWAWGDNQGGILGFSGDRHQPTPTKVNIPLKADGTPEEFQLLSAGQNHVLALTTDGRLFGWGNNADGQLTNGYTASGTPQEIKIPSLPNVRWETISASNGWSAGIIAGEFHDTQGLITLEAGSLYTWGRNNNGQIGDGTIAQRNAPVLIKKGHSFRFINMNATTHGVAIDTDGKLWSWGNDSYGQLGHGSDLSAAEKRSPQQIKKGSSDPKDDLSDVDLSSRNWINSITGGSFSLAIDSDGEMWAWGHNQYGMLGNGDTGNRNRPVRIQDPQL